VQVPGVEVFNSWVDHCKHEIFGVEMEPAVAAAI